MYAPLIRLLKKHRIIEENNDGTWGSVHAPDLLRVLQSPEYLTIVPRVRINICSV